MRYTMTLASIALEVLGACAQCLSAQPKSARQIAQEAFPSVVLIATLDTHSQPVSLGSGFVLKNGLIVTNHHVISGASSGYTKLVGRSMKYEIGGIAGADVAHDLVILSVNRLTAPALPIGDSEQVATGDEVYAVGNPEGLEGTFSQGIVSAVRQLGQDKMLQITAPISPGSSGGPILNSTGRIIGVAVATFTGGQNLNLAIPASYLIALLARISSEVQPLSRAAAKTEGHSILERFGEPGARGVIGENLEWEDQLPYGQGNYSFSLRNQLSVPVKDVNCLIIFFDQNGRPVDFDRAWFPDPIWSAEVIPAGLAKRITRKVDISVQRLTTSGGHGGKWWEIRILDFRIAHSTP